MHPAPFSEFVRAGAFAVRQRHRACPLEDALRASASTQFSSAHSTTVIHHFRPGKSNSTFRCEPRRLEEIVSPVKSSTAASSQSHRTENRLDFWKRQRRNYAKAGFSVATPLMGSRDRTVWRTSINFPIFFEISARRLRRFGRQRRVSNNRDYFNAAG